jgi:hypothetical protein
MERQFVGDQMPSMEWLQYKSRTASRDVLHGYFDCAISKCGILSMYLAYALLRSNGMIAVRYLGDIFEELEKLGGQDDRLRLLLNRGVLTRNQSDTLWEMAQYRNRHLPHLNQLPRYTGARCLVDGIRTVKAFRKLLNDNNFVAKMPEGLIPECVWGLWLG